MIAGTLSNLEAAYHRESSGNLCLSESSEALDFGVGRFDFSEPNRIWVESEGRNVVSSRCVRVSEVIVARGIDETGDLQEIYRSTSIGPIGKRLRTVRFEVARDINNRRGKETRRFRSPYGQPKF